MGAWSPRTGCTNAVTPGKSACDALHPHMKQGRMHPGWSGELVVQTPRQGTFPMSPAGVGDRH